MAVELIGVDTRIESEDYAQMVYMRMPPVLDKWFSLHEPLLYSLAKIGQGGETKKANNCLPPFKLWKLGAELPKPIAHTDEA